MTRILARFSILNFTGLLAAFVVGLISKLDGGPDNPAQPVAHLSFLPRPVLRPQHAGGSLSRLYLFSRNGPLGQGSSHRLFPARPTAAQADARAETANFSGGAGWRCSCRLRQRPRGAAAALPGMALALSRWPWRRATLWSTAGRSSSSTATSAINAGIIDEVMREVESHSARSSGLPTNEEALRQEESAWIQAVRSPLAAAVT